MRAAAMGYLLFAVGYACSWEPPDSGERRDHTPVTYTVGNPAMNGVSCDTQYTRPGYCGDLRLQAADQLLTKTYAQLIETIRLVGATDTAGSDAVKNLRREERAWIRERDITCVNLEQSARSRIVWKLTCLAVQTETRAKTLQARLDSINFGEILPPPTITSVQQPVPGSSYYNPYPRTYFNPPGPYGSRLSDEEVRREVELIREAAAQLRRQTGPLTDEEIRVEKEKIRAAVNELFPR